MLLVGGVLAAASLGLVARAFDLQVVRKQFYQNQADARFLREMPIAGLARHHLRPQRRAAGGVHAGDVDLGEPGRSAGQRGPHAALAQALGMDADALKQYLAQRSEREFVYLERQMSPDAAQAVLDLAMPGVNGQREFRRFYPSGEVTAHVLGFTNIDDHGQEGLELAFDDWLAGKPGRKRVIRDRHGSRGGGRGARCARRSRAATSRSASTAASSSWPITN